MKQQKRPHINLRQLEISTPEAGEFVNGAALSHPSPKAGLSWIVGLVGLLGFKTYQPL